MKHYKVTYKKQSQKINFKRIDRIKPMPGELIVLHINMDPRIGGISVYDADRILDEFKKRFGSSHLMIVDPTLHVNLEKDRKTHR